MRYIIFGRDGVGWSLDQDAAHLHSDLTSLNLKVGNFFSADIVFFVTWNELNRKIFHFYRLIFPKKKWVATLSNNPTGREKELRRACRVVDTWIVANASQRQALLSAGVNPSKIFKIPYPVDFDSFYKISKKEAFQFLGLNYLDYKDRLIIGNFQRDSLGENLHLPKWQKNPQLFLDIILSLKKLNPLVLIAGPRRHWLYSKLKEHDIDFLFYGDHSFIHNMKDDIFANRLPPAKINALYNCCNFTIVSSASEGGPKAIPESILSETPVWSTDVGFSSDLLNEFFIYNNVAELRDKILQFLSNPSMFSDIQKSQKKIITNHFSLENRRALLSKLISLASKDNFENIH